MCLRNMAIIKCLLQSILLTIRIFSCNLSRERQSSAPNCAKPDQRNKMGPTHA